MNELNIDPEANLLERIRHPENRRLPPVPPQASALTLRNEIMSDIIKMWEFLPLANIALLLLHLAKMCASLSAIVSNQLPCISARQIWLITMLCFDFLYSLVILARLSHAKKVKYSDSRQNMIHDENERNRQGNQDVNDPVPPPGEEYRVSPSFAVETSKLYRNHVIIWLLTRLFQLIWFLIFLWGQYLIIFPNYSSCNTQFGDALLMVYVILGYIWVLFPLVLAAVLYIFILIWFAIGRRTVTPAPAIEIDRLPVQEYSEPIEGKDECAVCMIDYELGDKIIQLQCNPKHFFHEECIKKWLRVNGICPICRVKIEQKS